MDHAININATWLVLGFFAGTQVILLVAGDRQHWIPRWSLRLFLGAVALQALAVAADFPILSAVAMVPAAAGMGMVMFGAIQNLAGHSRN